MDPFIGQIQAFGFNFAPRGWALCDGQLLPIAQNTALFSLLGTTYGGDGRTTFGLPDLRGRTALHQGRGPGLSSYRLGERGGTETVTLNNTQIPSHTHPATFTGTGSISVNSAEGEENDPNGNFLAKTSTSSYADEAGTGALKGLNLSGDVTVGNDGGGRSHENRQPFLVINYCIALAGLFPSRS